MTFIDTSPPSLPTPQVVVYEARAVHDTATLQLSDYRPTAESGWIVATVKPAAGSGSATIPGAHIEAETGHLVTPAQSEVVLAKHGGWHAIASGQAGAPASGTYAWNEPMTSSARVSTPEVYYSPFAHGGTVVFQFAPQAEAIQQFGACRLIFPEWAQSVADTLKNSSRIAELIAKLAAQPHAMAEAQQLVLGENGASATLAFRGLLQYAPAFALQAPPLLKMADARRLSIFVYLGLTAAPTKGRAEWFQLLRLQVMETSEPERLLAIAYAAFAVQLFAGQDSGSAHAAQELMQVLHKRVGELGLPMPENSPWTLLFRKNGIG